MIPFTRLAVILILYFASSGVFAQNDSLNLEQKSAAFANYLFQTSQYQYASEEYERLSYYYPENDTYKIRLIKSYRFSQDYTKGVLVCQQYIRPGSHPPKSVITEYTKLNILDNNYANINSIIGTLEASDSLRSNIDLATRLIFLPEKKLTTDGINLQLIDKPLMNLFDESYTLKHKSPALAGLMSTAIPGSGKVYTGRWKDGIIALVFVGVTGYQAYRGFDQKGVKSAYAWIMGSVAFSFYLGNIYGSAKSATVFNQNQRTKYVDKVSDYFIDNY